MNRGLQQNFAVTMVILNIYQNTPTFLVLIRKSHILQIEEKIYKCTIFLEPIFNLCKIYYQN
jgi:hypothetical protein